LYVVPAYQQRDSASRARGSAEKCDDWITLTASRHLPQIVRRRERSRVGAITVCAPVLVGPWKAAAKPLELQKCKRYSRKPTHDDSTLRLPPHIHTLLHLACSLHARAADRLTCSTSSSPAGNALLFYPEWPNHRTLTHALSSCMNLVAFSACRKENSNVRFRARDREGVVCGAAQGRSG
jgi:hypothetical protein